MFSTFGMLVALLLALCRSEAKIENTEVQRQYQIHDDLIVVSIEAEVINNGDMETNQYIFTVPPRELQHIGVVTASLNRKNLRKIQSSLPVTQKGNNFIVTLKSAIEPGMTQTIYFSYTLANYHLFLKQTVQLNQRIGLFFNCTINFVSQYETKRQSIVINGVSKAQIIKNSQFSPLKISSNQIVVGPFDDPQNGDFELEYTTSHAMPHINKFTTKTLISHWGKTKQILFYDVSNAGPKFTGEFNRIDFTQNSPCFIQTLPLEIPESAYSCWAEDESGQLQKEMEPHGNVLDIPLRGPMLSSWKATFTAGWTLLTSTFVNGNYRFQAPLLVKTIPAPVDYVEAEFVFPEGTKIVDYKVPILANVSEVTEVHNLDYNGRVALKIVARHLSTLDEIPITINYTLDSKYNFLKILLLGAAFSIVFIFIIFARRIDCSINVAQSVDKTKQD